ncbi:MAG: hypothetical protein JWN95_1497 [Frankiales bacterium]|nr:hypothetical protein [Frankiales bacterium]
MNDQFEVVERRLRTLIAARYSLLLALCMVALGCLRQPVATFFYDAGAYFGGAQALVHGGNVFDSGGLFLRGALTPIVYFPAALASALFGSGTAGFFVLLQNSIGVALFGVVLIPRLVEVWSPVSNLARLVSAVLSLLLIGPYSPFALMDLWTLLLALTIVLNLAARRPAALFLMGLLSIALVNIRPAYVVFAVLVTLWVLVRARLAAGWFVAGGVLAGLPQLLVNWGHGNGFSLVPPQAAEVTRLQQMFSLYVVRYDTIIDTSGKSPQQFYCDPAMAAKMRGYANPEGLLGVSKDFVITLPRSLRLVADKLAASVHWASSGPYLTPHPVADAAMATLATLTAVTGIALLSARFVRVKKPSAMQLGCLALLVSTVLSIAGSTPETRFALPLVALGIVGLLASPLFISRGLRELGAAVWPFGFLKTSLTMAIFVLVLLAGAVSLNHTAPRGGANAAICAGT